MECGYTLHSGSGGVPLSNVNDGKNRLVGSPQSVSAFVRYISVTQSKSAENKLLSKIQGECQVGELSEIQGECQVGELTEIQGECQVGAPTENTVGE